MSVYLSQDWLLCSSLGPSQVWRRKGSLSPPLPTAMVNWLVEGSPFALSQNVRNSEGLSTPGVWKVFWLKVPVAPFMTWPCPCPCLGFWKLRSSKKGCLKCIFSGRGQPTFWTLPYLIAFPLYTNLCHRYLHYVDVEATMTEISEASKEIKEASENPWEAVNIYWSTPSRTWAAAVPSTGLSLVSLRIDLEFAQPPITTSNRASNKGSRRFHNHIEDPY